jgi:magnesium-transporting ATPase (P-type)
MTTFTQRIGSILSLLAALLCAAYVALDTRVRDHSFHLVLVHRCHNNITFDYAGLRLVLGKSHTPTVFRSVSGVLIFWFVNSFQIFFGLLKNKSFWLALTVITTGIFVKDTLLFACSRIFFPTNEHVIQEVRLTSQNLMLSINEFLREITLLNDGDNFDAIFEDPHNPVAVTSLVLTKVGQLFSGSAIILL